MRKRSVLSPWLLNKDDADLRPSTCCIQSEQPAKAPLVLSQGVAVFVRWARTAQISTCIGQGHSVVFVAFSRIRYPCSYL